MRPRAIADAAVVLHLRVRVAPERRAAFLDFCRRVFPVYEGVGGTRMALYEDPERPGAYDATDDDRRRSEAALESDPAQAALIREWRALLDGPPQVLVFRRVEP